MRSSHPAIVVVNVALLPLGLVTLAAGLIGLVSATEIAWAFALLAIGGAVIFGGAIHGIIAWGRSVNVDLATARQMLTAARASYPSAPALVAAVERRTGPVLAHWTYAPAEWRAFARSEFRRRAREAGWMAAIIAGVGAPLIGAMEGEWTVALVIAAGTALFVGGGRFLLAWAALRRDQAVAACEVIVGPTAVICNGRYEALDDHRIRFSRAHVREGSAPAELVIEITVPGRYRRIPDAYHLPIPAGREAEAHAVAEALNRQHLPAAQARAILPAG